MGAVIGLAIVAYILFRIFGAASSNPTSQFDALVRSGTPARGILLQVWPTGTKAGSLGRRFELRQVYVDVEIPGRPPYETTARSIIPINLVRDVLPGATVELRVDPAKPSVIAIVGPGNGFVQQALRTA